MRIEGVSQSRAVATPLVPMDKDVPNQPGIENRNDGQMKLENFPGQRGPSEEEVIDAIGKANKNLELYDTRLEFSIHEETHQIMIKVFKNDQVIREIPAEKILDMVAKMMEWAGLLVDEKA